MPHLVYVLISEKDSIRYVGMSENPERRLLEHNSGKSKFTKGHMPWKKVYQEEFETRKEARAREKYFKSGVGREFLDRLLSPGLTEYPPALSADRQADGQGALDYGSRGSGGRLVFESLSAQSADRQATGRLRRSLARFWRAFLCPNSSKQVRLHGSQTRISAKKALYSIL
ncbi:GIY-YIG nuclease family protein [Jiulongibacter sediminis]|uniref:GIY-YIG nuclease family protein n=1 Tax=Jiulongibacter sediminis TaxID=1605367 RepID=UPI0009EC9912|nr:GIY-YIG nuclease family protein [Jiulongibacter sediminis]